MSLEHSPARDRRRSGKAAKAETSPGAVLPDFPDRWLTRKEAGALLGLAVGVLARDVCKGHLQLPYYRFGTKGNIARYKLSDLLRWAEQRRIEPRGLKPEPAAEPAAPERPAVARRPRGRPRKAA